jgi:benzoyl-CoA reductase/2-hydroxyglutaryl-CoA dehydratase subunit BcrC/BadD/HgdB
MSRLISHFKNSISTLPSDQRGCIGIFCPYTVEELVDAAGFKPVRLMPDRSELQLANGYLPSNFCSYLRHITDSALRGELKHISGILFSHSCDGARRTFDLFNRYIGDIPAQFIDVPKSSDELSVSYFRKQLLILMSFLERLGGIPFSDNVISRSIATYNHNRELLRRIYTLVASSGEKPGAEDLRHILDFNSSVSKKEANDVLERIVVEFESADDRGLQEPAGLRKRVFVSGNMFDSLPLLEYIEECGGVVVGDDFCFGGRYGQLTIEEHGDPLTALAKGYLNRVPCGRMKNNRDRFDFLLGEMERTEARGIIYTSLKFCDHFLVDYPALKTLLDEKGIPSLFLEGEYFSFAAGQVKTRVEAFLEML